MTETWMLRGIVGGLLIGISASLVLVLNGRVTGISGILNALMRKPDGLEYAWRALFVAGLLGGALLLTKLSESDTVAPSSTVALVAGALVGVGIAWPTDAPAVMAFAERAGFRCAHSSRRSLSSPPAGSPCSPCAP